LKSSSTLNMPVSFTESYARAKYARLLIFAPQPPRQASRSEQRKSPTASFSRASLAQVDGPKRIHPA
jgi:hypothetical protein